jgi:hypothetical protein
MSVVEETKLRDLRILRDSPEDGSLPMTWADEALLASGNCANVKERRYGR